MKNFTLIILVFSSHVLVAQNIMDYSVNEIDWKNWDMMHGDNSAKQEFLGSLYIQYPDESSKSIVPSDAKILDIDGDNVNDMLYLGSGGFSIYLNKRDSLLHIHSINEQISELSRKWPDAPLTFTTADLNCCGDDEWAFKHYHFFVDEDKFLYQVYRTEIIKRGTKDLFHNMPPTMIKIGANKADLVFGPGSGDIIQTYDSGRTGYAIASMKDDSGKLWWKVFIKESGYKLRAGWIERNKLVPVYQQR